MCVFCFLRNYLRLPLPPLLIFSPEGRYSTLCTHTCACDDSYVFGFWKECTEFRHVWRGKKRKCNIFSSAFLSVYTFLKKTFNNIFITIKQGKTTHKQICLTTQCFCSQVDHFQHLVLIFSNNLKICVVLPTTYPLMPSLGRGRWSVAVSIITIFESYTVVFLVSFGDTYFALVVSGRIDLRKKSVCKFTHK